MSKLKFKHWLSTSTLVGLGVLAAAPAWSATSAPTNATPNAAANPTSSATTSSGGGARARYLRQIEQCRNIKEHDTRANCLSEASTAYAQTQPTPPQENAMQLAQNALRRCDRVPEPDHSDCVARVSGAGMADGSVAGGGILYTLVTRETSPVAQANPPATSTTPGATAPSSVVPNPLPPPAAGPTPGAQPLPPPIEPAPADVPPTPPNQADNARPGMPKSGN